MKKNIAERLKRFADSKAPSYAAFARDIGMHPSSFHSTYLKGRSIPGGELLIKLALLGCDLNWLLLGVGSPPDPEEEELREYIALLEKQLRNQQKKLELLVAAREEIMRNMDRFLEQNPGVKSTLRDDDE